MVEPWLPVSRDLTLNRKIPSSTRLDCWLKWRVCITTCAKTRGKLTPNPFRFSQIFGPTDYWFCPRRAYYGLLYRSLPIIVLLTITDWTLWSVVVGNYIAASGFHSICTQMWCTGREKNWAKDTYKEQLDWLREAASLSLTKLTLVKEGVELNGQKSYQWNGN